MINEIAGGDLGKKHSANGISGGNEDPKKLDRFQHTFD